MHGRISQAAAVIVILALLITGCTSQASSIGMAKDKAGKAVDTGFTVSTVGSYDSADTAVVMSVDQQNNSVTLMNMDAGRQYTLYYDGTTYVKDKYSGPMTISQVRAGDVVDVNFLKGKRQLASIQLSPKAWVYDNVENYDLGGINKTASIGSNTYSLPEDVVVLSDGKRTEVMDIVTQDLLSIRGIDHKIYSINVEKGHGYLRLKNDQTLIGGWIEVGNTVIREITEDMLLVVPEGSYQVFLSNNGASCTKDIIVERDKEVVLDVGDLEVPQDKTGRIVLSVTPETAKVKIDNRTVDISNPVELTYGIHQIYLEAEGYDSLRKYIQVGSEYAKISFKLEEKKKDDNSSISQNSTEDKKPEKDDNSSVSDNTLNSTSGNKVYIDAPKNVEVYVDGNYRGISPVSFKKVTGSHTVTLRKSGYKTKSYTIYLYNDGEDITYSFTDLEKEGDSVSGNKNSSKSENSTREDKEPDLDVVGTVSGNNPIKVPDPIDEVITDEGNTKEPETPDESESEKKPGTSDGAGSEE
ncbi:MAG: PEGA domain-containing protein [Lachnospiraceae bacterium]|nr:PEGA domain-containing protein [Lachnospiraceae bacterium]